MTPLLAHTGPHPNHDVPDEFEPGLPPVAPDEGPPPIQIPDDPERERVIDPPSVRAGSARSAAPAIGVS